MSSFTTPLVCEDLPGGRRKLVEPFSFYVGVESKSCLVTVPVGFVTDGASIPRIFHGIVSPWGGEYAKAAVLHDYLYSTGYASRLIADTIFLEGMNVLKTEHLLAVGMFLAVRFAGGKAYKNYRKENQNEN